MFTWKPIYSELADVLQAWRSRQSELIAILHAAGEQGVPVSTLQDVDKKGNKFPLQVIDPFTFFGFFNRGLKKEHRIKLLTIIKDNLGLKSPLPTDFEGIPVMFPQRTWFFSYQKDREPDAIDTLWDFAKAIVEQPPEAVPAELFARTLALQQVGLPYLTMGMFWMRPDQYLAVDKRNRALLKKGGIEPDISDWPSYLNFLKQVKNQNPASSWAELSLKAYQEDNGGGEQGYWLFQANPDKFDLAGALKAGKLQTWQVNQHRKEIHMGDRVALWLSGSDAGVYGLATVTSEVGDLKESAEEAAFHLEPVDTSKSFMGVTLRVDSALCDTPIFKDALKQNKHTKAVPIGLQGTNFPITEKQFQAIEDLIPAKSGGRRYWIYAPGEHARFWEECLKKNIMVIGYDDLGDFRKYKSQSEIEQTLKKIWKLERRPYNFSRAVWEFTNVIQPGDIVIAKKGRGEYLGYGIVDGPYQPDVSRPEYKNFRPVKWIKSGHWTADFKVVVKTLTDITKYPDYVKKLQKTIGITAAIATQPQSPKILPALNIILYGPPGTGKTYQLRNHYMEMFTDRQVVLGVEERASALVKDLSWWEVVALALLDTKDKKGSVAQILEHPLVRARLKLSANKNPRAMLWASLQSHTKTDCPNVKYTTRIDPLLFSKDEASIWSVDAQLTETEVPELRPILQSFHNPPKETPVISRWKFTTFHQSFSYEDFVEGIKPQMEDRDDGQLAYEVRDGVFKEICQEATTNPNKPYALFIDEINRGNVASIFGELITLIEDDKRLGAANALTPELPYSRKTFGVPPNLYIIGTMNTADRSVEALDTALRRRFTFIEMRPDPTLITYPPSLNVDLQKLLAVMNDRIEQLLDHDHCIGHAYFMGINDLAGLRSVFASKIIPLLREYFYGNPAKVGMVLGERFVKSKTAKTPFAAGSWGVDELDEKEVFTFADTSKLSEEDFQTIYA